MRLLLVVVITLGVPRIAGASCVEEATALREHLTKEAGRARVWNIAWAIGFGAAVVGQMALALTETKPFGTFDTDYKEQMWVGAAKATLGVGSKVVLPLRIGVPPRDQDACVDVVALRAAIVKAGRKERGSVWLTIIGGTVVNVVGTIVLWKRRDFETGAISFAMGAPVGPISAFTQPRGSWRMWREREPTWTVGVGGVAGTPASMWIAGTF